MTNARILSVTHCNRWYFFLLSVLIFAGMIKCGDAQTPPLTGLLCISDCTTCPVICSPPPSPGNSKPPPSHPQPQPKPPTPPAPVHYYSPPQPYFSTPPPTLFPLPLPPASSPPTPPTTTRSPPPSYISWGNAGPPPPPPSNIFYGGGGGGNVPSIQGPPGMGQKNYSYPYYYFYASKAPSSCFGFLQGSSIFVILLSLHVLYFC